ncbi:MAG: selenide, water dikinase SelD [Acidimicrobiia bacterium]
MAERRLTEFSHGAGCGCKLSPVDLAEVIGSMAGHPATISPDLVVGFGYADDAGVFRLPSGEHLIQTVDFFTPIVDDSYLWGEIAAVNALSDVYAMGGRPLTALQLVCWPRDELPFSVLAEVIRGGADAMAKSGTTIVGGHSIDDPEPKYGFAVTGLLTSGEPVTNSGALPGDLLVLTKPLGTGVVSTAIKRGVCPDALRDAAVEVMTLLNAGAAIAMVEVGVHAATDVTGFGLLGHLGEVLTASGVGATIRSTEVPVLSGVSELVEAGVYPGGSKRNLAAVAPMLDTDNVDETMLKVLADAQTSGGLLISVAPDQADGLVVALTREGALSTSVIGEITEGQPRIRLE